MVPNFFEDVFVGREVFGGKSGGGGSDEIGFEFRVRIRVRF